MDTRFNISLICLVTVVIDWLRITESKAANLEEIISSCRLSYHTTFWGRVLISDVGEAMCHLLQ